MTPRDVDALTTAEFDAFDRHMVRELKRRNREARRASRR